jgi:hypothetical protein
VGPVTPISRRETTLPGGSGVKDCLLAALRQAFGEPFHVSNSGIGPACAAWATLILEGPC